MSFSSRLAAYFAAALAVPLVVGGIFVVVVLRDADPAALRFGLLALVAGVAVAIAIGVVAARRVTSPLRELAEGARRVAAGDLDASATLDVRGDDALGKLGRSLETLAAQVRTVSHEAAQSRGELERALTEYGHVLERTHDRAAILGLATRLSRADVGARSAAVWQVIAGGLEVVHLDGPGGELEIGTRLPLGYGLAGWVAQAGRGARSAPAGTEFVAAEPVAAGAAVARVAPGAPEPAADAVAVPIMADGRVHAVLSLYGRHGGSAFADADVDLLTEFARQAGVAIENVLLHEEANRLAIRDALTGVWNRRYFDLMIGPEIERAARYRHPLGLLMVDVDHFKGFNDTFGHQAGDEVLVGVAQTLAAQVREVDVLARYGGEEFVVLLPETDRAGALVAAEKIRAQLAANPFQVHGTQVPVTASIGVAVFPEHAPTASRLISAADAALYAAKGAGRNRVRLAEAPPVMGGM